MTEDTRFDMAALKAELDAASSALQAFAQGPARRAAEDVSVSFERAGDRIARALGRAAAGGEASFRQLAKTVLEELAKIALDRVLMSARAAPPSILAADAPPGALNPVAVHFHLGAGADAASVARHQGQIAAAVARAVAYGRRNL